MYLDSAIFPFGRRSLVLRILKKMAISTLILQRPYTGRHIFRVPCLTGRLLAAARSNPIDAISSHFLDVMLLFYVAPLRLQLPEPTWELIYGGDYEVRTGACGGSRDCSDCLCR